MGNKKAVDDRFKRFGTVSFTALTRVNDFITHLEQDKVMGTRCTTCGRTFFPPRADCFKCLPGEMEWFEVSGQGRLVTFSRLKYGPVGFEDDLPYAIALVEYDGFKVFGRIADDIPEQELRVGMAMETKANRLPGGQLNYVFQKAGDA